MIMYSRPRGTSTWAHGRSSDEDSGIAGPAPLASKVFRIGERRYAHALFETIKFLCMSKLSLVGYVKASLYLAKEYLAMGAVEPVSKIFEELLPLTNGNVLAPSTVMLVHLQCAEFGLAIQGGGIERGIESYIAAASILEETHEGKSLTSTQRLFNRIEQLERAALASRTFSLIQYHKVSCLSYGMHSNRNNFE
jgi:hypothetical protein